MTAAIHDMAAPLLAPHGVSVRVVDGRVLASGPHGEPLAECEPTATGYRWSTYGPTRHGRQRIPDPSPWHGTPTEAAAWLVILALRTLRT